MFLSQWCILPLDRVALPLQKHHIMSVALSDKVLEDEVWSEVQRQVTSSWCPWSGRLSWGTLQCWTPMSRGGICPSRQCRRQCKIFASGVNFSIFTHFCVFFLLKRLKLGKIYGVKFLTWKSSGVNFWTNSMSVSMLSQSLKDPVVVVVVCSPKS